MTKRYQNITNHGVINDEISLALAFGGTCHKKCLILSQTSHYPINALLNVMDNRQAWSEISANPI